MSSNSTDRNSRDSLGPNRLRCPNCKHEFGVRGIAALGVTDGEERPCSVDCADALEAETDQK